jgi:hypothetical protein
MERLPKWLLCIPLVAQWFWLGARYRSLTLPSVVNPEIETGGLAGESKFLSLARLQQAVPGLVAETRLVRPGEWPDAGGLDYPLIAKPDIGWCGYGVRLIRSSAELASYAAAFPKDAAFLLQRYAAGPDEAGLFFMRQPAAPSGRLVSMTIRHPPHVIGDGKAMLACLIAADPRTRPHAKLYSATALASIPAEGETVVLATIASLRAGARYEDATALVTPALEAAILRAAEALGRFSFGRFDVRYSDLPSLLAGRFTIIEVNGAGAEAIQFWDPRLSLRQAFAGVFAKQRLLFELAAEWRLRGERPVGVLRLAQTWLRQQGLIGRYPASD